MTAATEPTPPPGNRVVLLRSDAPQHLHLERMLASKVALVGVIVESGHSQRGRLWRERRYNIAFWRAYHLARERTTGRVRAARRFFGDDMAVDSGAIHHVTVQWINDVEVVDTLERWRPDITVVCGTGLIRPEVLSRAGVAINVHGGLLPWYRGNHGVFFACARLDHARVGVSVHLVTERLDEGPVLFVATVQAAPGDRDDTLYLTAFRAATAHLADLLARLSPVELVGRARPQPGSGSMFRHRDRTPALELAVWWRRHRSRERLGPGEARSVVIDE